MRKGKQSPESTKQHVNDKKLTVKIGDKKVNVEWGKNEHI